MRRRRENPFPNKTGPRNSGIFQRQPRATKPRDDNPGRKSGDGAGSLTTNKSKPSGGYGSSGPITSVADTY